MPTNVLNDINENKKTNKNADSWIGILPKFREETDKKLSTNLSILCNGIPGVFDVQTKRLLMFCQTTIFIILFERSDRVGRTRFTSLTIFFFFLSAFFSQPSYICTSIQVKVHKLVFVTFTYPIPSFVLYFKEAKINLLCPYGFSKQINSQSTLVTFKI